MIMQVLNQDETPLLYSLVFGEGVVNDATSVVLFNAIKSFDLEQLDHGIALQFFGNFLYLFIASTMLGVLVTVLLSLILSSTNVHVVLVWCVFIAVQGGLLSAYIIKKLYIGRYHIGIPELFLPFPFSFSRHSNIYDSILLFNILYIFSFFQVKLSMIKLGW